MTRRRRGNVKRSAREPNAVQRSKWSAVVNPYPPLEVLSQDHLETIHRTSLNVLRDTGIKFLSDDARNILRSHGADVDEPDQMVRFDPDLVESLLTRTTGSFTIKARNRDRSVLMGDNSLNFGTVGGPSFVTDLDRGRRAGTIEDLHNFLKVAAELEIFHFCGASPIEPIDLPAASRHLDKYYASITIHDRLWTPSMLGGFRAADALEMTAIAHGISYGQLADETVIMGNINVNSPRQVDGPMAEAMIEFARVGQGVIVTPFTLLGAMAPTTMAGALVQQNAEALACIALIQAVNPGSPVVYGTFSSNVDMRTGAPAFGTPEYVRTTLASGQLARRYGLPLRSSGANASNAPDAQAAYETSMSIWSSLLGYANMLHQGGGWLEGGLTASFEKLIIDAEMLQMFAELLKPMEVSEDTLAEQAIADIPPGGHFFGSAHTMERYEDIFYSPLLSDWRNFETWNDDGGLTASRRANRIWKTLLDEYQPAPIDPATVEQLDAYVSARKSQIESGGENAVLHR